MSLSVKAILFDYGHTLLYEPGWDAVRGNEALLKYVTKNPNNCTLEDVRKAFWKGTAAFWAGKGGCLFYQTQNSQLNDNSLPSAAQRLVIVKL